MELIKNGKPVDNFLAGYGVEYVMDTQACIILNKVLNTNFKAVYREKRNLGENQWGLPSISMDFENVYILRDDGKIINMSISEWFTLSVEE